MKLTKTIMAGLILSLATACGSEESTANQNDESVENLVNEDSTNIDAGGEEEIQRASALPILADLELKDEAYVIGEVLAEISSQVDNSQSFKVVLSEEGELILGIFYSEDVAEESFVLEIGDFNDYGTEIKLEWADVNKDETVDELVIWWTTFEGNNGVTEGYEVERSGVLIYNVNNRFAMVNFCYSDFYATYVAGENANTNDDNFHAKADDSSVWEICSYSQIVELRDGNLVLSSSNHEVENFNDCKLNLFIEGTYAFSNSNGKFELTE